MKTTILLSLLAGTMILNVTAQAALPDQISGTVRDTNGTPVVGVEVAIMPQWTADAPPKTDTNGHFQIPIRNRNIGQGFTPFLLVRDLKRNLAVVQDIDEETKTYDLQMAPGLTISGRVQDEQGKPLANATAQLTVWTGNYGFGIQHENAAKFDAEGRFELATLPIGRRYSVTVTAKGYGSASSNSQEPEANRLELPTFTLRVADQKIAGVVLDADEDPVKGAHVYIYGQGQPNNSTQSDKKGWFSFDVCEGTVTISASTSGANSAYGSIRCQGGDTNIVIRLGQQGTISTVTQRAPLTGKPLPDLAAAGISADVLPAKKPLLICLFDPDQRPSRRLLRLLGEQNETLKQKGVTVLGISAALTEADALKEWKQSNPQPFTIGAVSEKTDRTKWILTTGKFPWLILTDSEGRVKAEGFDLDELDAKLK